MLFKHIMFSYKLFTSFSTEICMHMFLCNKMIFLNDMENVSIFLFFCFYFSYLKIAVLHFM